MLSFAIWKFEIHPPHNFLNLKLPIFSPCWTITLNVHVSIFPSAYMAVTVTTRVVLKKLPEAGLYTNVTCPPLLSVTVGGTS